MPSSSYNFDTRHIVARRTDAESGSTDPLIAAVKDVTSVTCLWLTTFIIASAVVLLVAVCMGRSDVFAIATNVLFAWSISLAWHTGADSTAVVLIVAFVASILHHTCDHFSSTRHELSLGAFILLAIVFASLIVAYSAWRRRRDDDRRAWSWGVIVLLALAMIGSMVAAGFAASERLDGCLYLHDGVGDFVYEMYIVPKLLPLWSVVDDATAVAVIVASLLFVTRAESLDERNTGHFWLLVAFSLVLHMYMIYLKVSTTTKLWIYAVLGVALLIVFVPRFIVSYRERARIHWLELVGATLIIVASFLDFLIEAGAWAHGAWHIGVALGLSILLDAAR